LLLTNYDPFYSPLLSRLDAVFSRLGHNTEGCREYAVCAMYRSPARYAPYSNLVSAQLSRELNELRKPSSDNPDVLRFFRYMKSAKDGQDGVKCEEIYANCANAREDQTLKQNQAMLATYQDINKLVQARKIWERYNLLLSLLLLIANVIKKVSHIASLNTRALEAVVYNSNWMQSLKRFSVCSNAEHS